MKRLDLFIVAIVIIALFSNQPASAAGQVTAQGTFRYYDRNSTQVSSRYMNVYLYDHDLSGYDDLLATTTSNAQGFFQFISLTNDDADDPTDPDRRLDLYVVWEADYADNGSNHHPVTNFSNQIYKWQSTTHTNAPDGTADFTSVEVEPNKRPAMWIFQDLRNAWEYIRIHTSPQFDPGSVTAKWEDTRDCFLFEPFLCSSFFYVGAGGPFIFISNQNINSLDTIVHETGHHFMYNATDWWLWGDIGCYEHNLFSEEYPDCAWSEGWADFLPLTVNGDPCYDFGIGPCGAGSDPYENLETHTWNENQSLYPNGDGVEGRVAGALYDLFDNVNEGYDSAAFGFDPIADIVFHGAVEGTFSLFWSGWKTSGQNKHNAVRAIHQNTIDYDTAPRFDPPLPDRIVLQNSPWIHAIELWDYSNDDESVDAELSFYINYVSDTHCGIGVDNHWININPQTGWLGVCDATIRVNDSIYSGYDTFRVTVAPVAARRYLPIIMR